MTDDREKKADIHRPDGIFRGEKIGHVDSQARIRRRDGVFRGERLGYVDESGGIRKPDGVFRGAVVGKIKGNAAHGRDGIFAGQKWGYVDEDGNVRVRDGIFRGRIVGKVRGGNVEGALGYFVLQFEKLEERFGTLEAEVRQAKNKNTLLGKVRHMLDYVPTANALGDFDRLVSRLRDLESELAGTQSRNHERKEDLCRQAESLSASTEWKAVAERLRQLQVEWKDVGSAGRDCDDRLGARFRTAQDRFYERRSAHFEKQAADRHSNRSRKEALCSRAESLAGSTDWKGASEALRALQAEWKMIGPAGRDHDDALWSRFRTAQDRYFSRRQAHFEQQDQQRQRSRVRKEALCSRAEALAGSSDWKDAGDALKALQSEWKAAGPAGRDFDDALWERFRRAQDRFFQRRSALFESREREQRENLARKEHLCSRAESLAHASDYKSATGEVKELQAAWKAIGHVPRESADRLWARFRSACDRVFEQAQHERERRQSEWSGKMRDALDRKREQYDRIRASIEHDLGNIERWRDTIDNLRPGGRAGEIASDLLSRISDVEDRVSSKRSRLNDLRDSIRDIEAKL